MTILTNKQRLMQKQIREIQRYRTLSTWVDEVNSDGIELSFVNAMIFAKLRGSRDLLDFVRELNFYKGKQATIEKLVTMLQGTMSFIKKTDGEKNMKIQINLIQDSWIKLLMIGVAQSIKDLSDPMVVYSKISYEN